MSHVPRLRPALALAFVILVAPAAKAEGSRADLLFKEGRAAAVAGDYPTARAKFVESQRLDPAVGTLLNIADCEEHLGHPAAALSVFRFALPQLDPNDHRAAIAKARIDELERLAPRLTITVVDAAAGTTVLRDGITIDARELGVPSPVEPGAHVVTLRAPGRHERATTIVLREGQSETVVLDPSRLERDAPVTAAAASRGTSDRTKLGFAALGLGTLGVLVAGVSWLGMRANADVLEGACDKTTKACSGSGAASALDAQSAGRTWSVVNYVAWGISAVGLGAGAYLLLTGRTPGKRAVVIVPASGGLAAVGRF